MGNLLMDFGGAIKSAKEGKKVARLGWYPGVFAYIVPGNAYPAQSDAAKSYWGDRLVPYKPYWAVKNPEEVVETWLPNCSDTLAEDWVILD
jgi:hypothetical protein